MNAGWCWARHWLCFALCALALGLRAGVGWPGAAGRNAPARKHRPVAVDAPPECRVSSKKQVRPAAGRAVCQKLPLGRKSPRAICGSISRINLMAGGDTGPAVVAGRSQREACWSTRINYGDTYQIAPPRRKLPAEKKKEKNRRADQNGSKLGSALARPAEQGSTNTDKEERNSTPGRAPRGGAIGLGKPVPARCAAGRFRDKAWAANRRGSIHSGQTGRGPVFHPAPAGRRKRKRLLAAIVFRFSSGLPAGRPAGDRGFFLADDSPGGHGEKWSISCWPRLTSGERWGPALDGPGCGYAESARNMNFEPQIPNAWQFIADYVIRALNADVALRSIPDRARGPAIWCKESRG